MTNDWLNNKDSYLIKGESLNQIIAMLQILEERNTNIERLGIFIEKLKSLTSYNEILHAFLIGTRAENMSIKKSTANKKSGLTLEEILKRLDMRLSGDDDHGEN